MNVERPFPGLIACAKYVLAEQDIARILEPAIADALHERSTTHHQRSWLWRTRLQIIHVIFATLWENALQQLKQVAWEPFLLLWLAGLSGSVVLGGSQTYRAAAAAHCVFLGLGFLGALLIITTPKRLLRGLYGLAACCGVLAIAACPWFGESFEGQRQWLRFGSLQIHISTLFLPVYATFASSCASRSKRVRLLVASAVCLVLLALQPNWQAFLVYLCTLVASVWQYRARWLPWLVGAVVIAGGVFSMLRLHEWSGFTLVGNAALLLAILFGTTVRRDTEDAPDSLRSTALAAMVALVAVSGWAGDRLPVVGFGGSAIVASFVLCAAQARARLYA